MLQCGANCGVQCDVKRPGQLKALLHMRNLQVYRYVDAIARAGSIRKAAEQLSITPSALNRRILALEEELGVEVFDRLGRGVRLSTSGELLVDMMRKHLAEAKLLSSRIADLSGLRRGHVSVACSQAVLPYFLPSQIKLYQLQFPQVTFNIMIRDGEAAQDALLSYDADLVIVFEPLQSAQFHTICAVPQPIQALMSRDHPLAQQDAVRLSDCLDYPLALPSRSYAVRQILDSYAARLPARLEPSIEAESYVLLRNFVADSQAIAFELAIGLPPEKLEAHLVSRPLQVPRSAFGSLYLAQLRERTLPVASARFAQQLMHEFEETWGAQA
ncbi:MAG: DNA-binding transcriptional LysR family regulator [Paracoccaceae bacterium]|jgi:DNA-binding transcriptional LysR family regulator